MINKKDENANIHEKPKKRKKYRKNQLTSMTSHVKDKKEKGQIDIDDDEREEDPEDGDGDDGLAHIEEEDNRTKTLTRNRFVSQQCHSMKMLMEALI